MFLSTCRACGPRGLRNTTMRISGSRLSRMSKMMTSQADTELSMLAKTKYKRCCLRKGLHHREGIISTQRQTPPLKSHISNCGNCEVQSNPPYYSTPEKAENNVESQGPPDNKMVDPCPMPRVQSKLERDRCRQRR